MTKYYPGQQIFKITLVAPTGEYQGSGRAKIWEALCECGNTLNIVPYSIGETTNCGCKYRNKKFAKLTLLCPSDQKRRTAILWKALCDCGNITYVVPSKVAAGTTKSCGCLSDANIPPINRKWSPVISSARRCYRHYSDGDCVFESFYLLSQEPCYYCGSPPHAITNDSNYRKDASNFQKEQGNFIYNGLDRIDNSLGHDVDNVVPCCWTCNRTKSDTNFIDYVSRISKTYGRLLATYTFDERKIELNGEIILYMAKRYVRNVLSKSLDCIPPIE